MGPWEELPGTIFVLWGLSPKIPIRHMCVWGVGMMVKKIIEKIGDSELEKVH